MKTYLPQFPGFYGTYFEFNDNEVCQEIADQLDIDVDYVTDEAYTLDYTEWQTQYAKDLVVAFNEAVKIPGIQHFFYDSIYSPREYNFCNDSINIEADITCLGKLQEFLLSLTGVLHEEFTEFLSSRYTSCDGFWSHYSYDPADWIEHINEGDLENHRLGTLIEFYMGAYNIKYDIDSPDVSDFITVTEFDRKAYGTIIEGEKQIEAYRNIMGNNDQIDKAYENLKKINLWSCE